MNPPHINLSILADPAQDPRPYFFLHLPKTAGISLWQLLEAQFPPQQVFRGWLHSHLIAQKSRGFGDYRLFRGHFYGQVEALVGTPLRTFTLVRHPVARAVSQYAQLRWNAEPGLRRRVQQLGSLRACLQDPALRPEFADYQARSLALTGNTDDPDLERAPVPAADALLAAAQRRLDAMAAVGTTERYAEFVRLLCGLFDWDPFHLDARENVGPDAATRQPLNAEDHALLLSLNPVDVALHAYADRLLTAHIESLRGHRRDHPDFWATRDERRGARLAARIHALEVESRRFGARLGAALHHGVDRAFPRGSLRALALHPFAWVLRKVLG
ncbi:MAG TPA: hypothetical protein VF678_02415 [bacterium]